MRTALLLTMLTALALPAASVATSPRLATEREPTFLVRGFGFAPRERVRVVVSAKTSGAKWVVTSAKGGFVLRFPLVRFGYCQAYAVRAIGTKGSHAALRFTPECAQP
jgi:hypothetical protein